VRFAAAGETLRLSTVSALTKCVIARISKPATASNSLVRSAGGLSVAKSARSGQRPRVQFLGVSALGPRAARSDHTLAIRRKCDCIAGLSTSLTNCIQSAARRMHSNSCFRQLTDSGTAHLLETPRILAQHRVFCRWSAPQRKAEKNHKLPFCFLLNQAFCSVGLENGRDQA
jgi:hypothetical protein